MARRAVSVTLDEANLLWLRGRARVTAGGNVSQLVDGLVTAARTGRAGPAPPVRSVVGTIQLPADDPDLSKADEAVRALFEESLSRPLFVREPADAHRARPGSKTPIAKRRRRG